MRIGIKGESGKEIGWGDDLGTIINYYSWKHSITGSYNKTTKVYTRYKQIPGRSIPMPNTGDYGESDIRYWG